MQGQVPSGNGNILQEWVSDKSQTTDVVIRSWYYSVSAWSPRQDILRGFDWEGVILTKSKTSVSVSGKFIIADEAMQNDWSGHLFEIGEVRLFEGDNASLYPYLSVEIRVNDMCCNEVTKAFVLGLCCREEGRVRVRLKVKVPTVDEWAQLHGADRYKDRDRIVAVEGFSVYSAGGQEEEVV